MQRTRRIAMGVSYDGSSYHGWQRQDHDDLPTVQFYVESALSRVANHAVEVVCAGRTDAGVHACQQVIHFDTDADRTDYSWVFGTNSNLPHDISMLWAQEVNSDFHARFSATARRYRYLIYDAPIRPAILRNGVSWCRKPLDVNAMQLGANYLLGEHDFSSFRGADCQSKTAIRDLQHLTVRRIGQLVVLDVEANAFLLHMVRNIVGVLTPIGMGARPPEWAKTVLQARQRAAGGVTAMPNGLYFISVKYSDALGLPKNSAGPFFLGGGLL
jgi:tRNA pseudouridine38-40 synthase